MRHSYIYPSLINNLKFIGGILYGRQAFVGPHTVMIDIEDSCDLNCIMCYFHSPLLVNAEKPILNADIRKSNADKRRFYPLELDNPRPSAFSPRESALKDIFSVKTSLKKDEEFQRLNYNTYKNILEELKSMGTRKISICGRGEPFLHPKILDIIELTKYLKFYINIFTNGIHIKNFGEKIFELDQIIFSLHAADKDTYYKVHPHAGKGCFEDIRYILGQIRDYKYANNKVTPWVKIINVIFNLNYHKIDEMFAFAEEFKVDEILFKPVQLRREHLILKMDREQINHLIRSLRKWQNSKIKNNINTYIATIMPYTSVNMDKPFRKVCYVPWYQSAIFSNGDVVACPYNQAVLGNINNNSFRKIWFSSEYNRFRQTLDCGNCAANAVYPHLLQFKNLFPWKRRR